MVFSSNVFLFGFLPIVLTAYFLLPGNRSRNLLLLTASLFFYAWGEQAYVALLLASVAFNYALGLAIDRRRGRPGTSRVLGCGIAVNLLALGVFKYANFVADSIDPLLVALGGSPIELEPVHLPIGISFFTFQALTYIIDVHRRDAPMQRNPLHVALYISLFPQLIAGPIVRYRQVAEDLVSRRHDLQSVAAGLRRLVIGLGKKVLVANTLAVPADRVFAAAPGSLSPEVAWIGAVCFAFQIYFDFSGYSDMAIGMGRIFGFRFPENFRYPYTSRSIREFWRRWHISLSTWFRDYLYIPLGGSRASDTRTAANLFTVFLLCGLWHGASWNFAVWGLLHGSFLAAERTRWGERLARLPQSLQLFYTWGVVLFAWVFFRAETLGGALVFLAAMLGLAPPGAEPEQWTAGELLQTDVCIALLAAVAGSGSWVNDTFLRVPGSLDPARGEPSRAVHLALRLGALLAMFLGSAMALAAGTHNPFIYFRF